MKKVILSLVLLTGFVFAQAQKGNNQIGVAAELGLPIGDLADDAKIGVGGSVKGLYGVGTAGQLTLTAGFTSHKAKGEDADGVTFSIIPVLAGYRHNFSGFYVEPQLGFGSYKAKFAGISVTESAFTYAVGVGYAMNGFDAGIRYQGASKDSYSYSLIGIRIGYNFSLGGGSSK